jgi:hypothetical protein
MSIVSFTGFPALFLVLIGAPAPDNQHYRGPAAKAPRGGLATRQSRKIVRSGPLRTDKTPEHQYFADGITEDLTTDLSRIGGDQVADPGFIHSTPPPSSDRDTAKLATAELGPSIIKLPIRVFA